MSVMIKCPQCARLNRLPEGKDHELRCKCGSSLPRGTRTFVAIIRPTPGGAQTKRVLQASNKRDALAEEAALLLTLREQDRKDPDRMTWADVAIAFLKRLDIDGGSRVYRNDTFRFLNAMGQWWGEQILCANIHVKDIRAFQLHLRESGKAPATCDRYLAAGKAAWNYSLPDLPNPFKRVSLYRPDNEVTMFLQPGECSRFLAVAKDISRTLYEIVFLALTTGLRKSNILRLRRDQVDFGTRTVTVIQKGGRSLTLPLSQPAVDLLSKIPDNQTPYFWVSSVTGAPYHKDWRRPWERLKREAGIPQGFRFHDLRHDAGTQIYGLTRDIRLAKELLGHRDIKTTMRYAHVIPERLREGVDLLSARTVAQKLPDDQNPQ